MRGKQPKYSITKRQKIPVNLCTPHKSEDSETSSENANLIMQEENKKLCRAIASVALVNGLNY